MWVVETSTKFMLLTPRLASKILEIENIIICDANFGSLNVVGYILTVSVIMR